MTTIEEPKTRGTRRLHPAHRDLLLAAHAAEWSTTGAEQREAFRATRAIIGALRQDGWSLTSIAGVLGLQPDSIRSRTLSRGFLTRAQVVSLTALSEGELASANLQPAQTRPGDELRYAALDVVRHLYSTESPRAPRMGPLGEERR